MVMVREPAVRPQRGKYPCGISGEGVGANSTWCQSCKRRHHQRCSGLGNVRRAGDNFRYPMCVRGVVAVPQRFEVGEDSLELVNSFRYLGDVISCGEGIELVVRDRISCACSKWRELTSLLVNHTVAFPLEERAKAYCACVRPAMLYAAEIWALTERLEELLASCNNGMMSRVRWKDRITNEEVRRRCWVKNLEHRIRKMRLRWFGYVKHRNENSIVYLGQRLSWRWKVQ